MKPSAFSSVSLALIVTLFIAPRSGISQTPQRGGEHLEAALEAVDRFLDDDKWREAGVFIESALPESTYRTRAAAYLRCRRLYDRFRRGRTNPRLRAEIGRQTVRAYHDLETAAGDAGLPITLRIAYQLGKFHQDRARWRLDFNQVLYAVEIDADLTRSSNRFRVVTNTPADDVPPALPWMRSLADLNDRVNLYLRARLLSASDVRKAAALNLAFDRLYQFFEANPGTLAGRRAYLYAGLCQELGGAPEVARAMFLDLVPNLADAWTEQTTPFLSEAVYHFCRLDRTLSRATVGTGARARRSGRAAMLAPILRRALNAQSRPPTRYAIRAFGEIALARIGDADRDPATAATRFEDDAAWLDRATRGHARSLLAPYARRLVDATPSFSPKRHPLLGLLAAKGLEQDLKYAAGRDLALRIARDPSREPALRHRAWETVARCWEGSGFRREAAKSLDAADRIFRGGESTHRYAASLWRKIAAASDSPRDQRRYDAALDRLPRAPGTIEYRAGMTHFRRAAYADARRWLLRVPAGSRFHPLAVAYATYSLYVLLDAEDATTPDQWEDALPALDALDRIPAGAPNLLPALALARLTEALILRKLGRQPEALRTLDGFEDRFTPHRDLVAEALKFRIALQVERDAVGPAERTLAELSDRFPTHRGLGEASLILGRHLSRRARASARRVPDGLERSVRLRRNARTILRARFPATDRLLLAVDEMRLENWTRALELLDELDRKTPPALADRKPVIDDRRARCLMRLGRLAEARTVVDALVASRPNHVGPLRLKAILLGGTIDEANDRRFVSHRYLGKHRDAERIWSRLLEHASRTVPYGRLWFEAQFHRVLMFHWLGRPDYARQLTSFVRVDYDDFGGEPFPSMLDWIQAELGK